MVGQIFITDFYDSTKSDDYIIWWDSELNGLSSPIIMNDQFQFQCF